MVGVHSVLLGPIVCCRAFPVAGHTIWNSLLDNVISALPLSTFRKRLQTFLFLAEFPDIIIDHP